MLLTWQREVLSMWRVPILVSIGLLALSLAGGSGAGAVTDVQRADVDQDGVVTIFDLATVTNQFGAHTTGRADVDGDGTVTIFDLTLVAQHFGEHVVATPTPTQTPAPAPTATPPPATRDKLRQPFASTSPWNMPLGAGARYAPVGFKPDLDYATVDEDVIVLTPNAPRRDLYIHGNSIGRCVQSGLTGVRVPIPDAYQVPDADSVWKPNFAGAFLMPDGRTIVQTSATARCGVGAPVTAGFRVSNVDIYGDGIAGGHGGSGMSSVGGSIRLGELVGAAPIRHALKMNIDCLRYCSQANGGYRWPALNADMYALNWDGYGSQGYAVPGLGMGSLLALPPSLDIGAMGLETAAGKKLAWTLQNYGAYVVDDAHNPAGNWSVIAWDAEKGADDELFAATGYRLDTNIGPSYRDTVRIVTALAMVDNNGPSSVGGGGTPRQPLAPPIGN